MQNPTNDRTPRATSQKAGGLLRAARLKLGFTQKMLADFACVGASTIQRAEQGQTLRPDSIHQLCQYFSEHYHRKVTPEELGLAGQPRQNTGMAPDLPDPDWPPLLFDPAILSHPEFVKGFEQGIDAYGGKCEDDGRKMTGREVMKDMGDELTPSAEMRMATEYYAHRFEPIDPRYIVGFMAGELYAHFLMPDPPASGLPLLEDHPTVSREPAKIIPIRMR